MRVKRIFGFLLAVYGSALIFKLFFIHPTIFTKVQFDGFTPYHIGEIAGAISLGLLALIFGLKWLTQKSKPVKITCVLDKRKMIMALK